MTLPQAQFWSASSGNTLSKLEELLLTAFQLQETLKEEQKYTFFDDADWHLWQAQFILGCTVNSEYRLFAPDTTTDAKPPQKNPRFWWDFPPGRLQDTLKKHIKLRALLSIGERVLTQTHYNLMNEDQKTVAKLAVVALQGSEPTPQSYFISLFPLRGFCREFQQAAMLCESLSLPSSPEPNLVYLLQSQEITPPPTGPKSYGIAPDQPTENVVRHMLEQMILEAQQHQAGILDDIDTEFLHQYRVALRKSRSLLNLMRNAFTPEWQLALKSLLASMAQPTNRLRDLDVFLLDQSHYQSMLPQQFQAGLTLLFRHIRQQRNRAHKQLAKTLQTDSYRQLFEQARQLLEGMPAHATATAAKPVIKIAQKRILKRYQKICAVGVCIDHNTPDEQVHELRIECKKLRYLLDFFAELFPEKQVTKLLKSLKNLQNILGNFNDCSVQQLFLNHLLTRENSPDVQAAIHGLIAVLHQRQLGERAKVAAAFTRFAATKVANYFHTLCSQ